MSTYPVHVDAQLDPAVSRWQWLFKWLLAIPHYVVLAFLWVAFVVLSVVAFFAILFTGRYPRGIFDFNVGVLRWTWRVSYYAYGALATDRYPPFTLEERADYPAHLEIDYPEHLSPGLVLVKWWLLAIPHYLVIGVFLGGVGWAASDAADSDNGWAGGGLISLLVLFAAVVLLFKGRYPRSIFDLVLGLNRWVLRVAAYAALMTDAYPPFRLDQGGDDPSTLRAATVPAAPAAATAPPVGSYAPTGTPWPADPQQPTGATGGPGAPAPTSGPPVPPPSSGTARRWGPGRIIALVVGSLVILCSAGVGVGGAALAVADNGLRDDDGFLMSNSVELTTGGYAIATTDITLDADVPSAFMPDDLLGDVKVTATGDRRPVFLGIARTTDADAYLAGVEHATLTDFADGPVYDTSGSTAPRTPPGESDIWVAQASGTGDQELVWEARSGHWTLVVMNADGSRGITTDTEAGATVPALDWLWPTLLIAAAVGLGVGTLVLFLALRQPTPRPTA